jgi:quercetin dioxygenase-like cupin family protein
VDQPEKINLINGGESMKIVKISDVPLKQSESPLFEGGRVHAQPLIGEDFSEVLRVVVMNFDTGAVTKFHTHEFEQILFVLSGKGRVATEQEEHTVLPGTIVFIPPGENHLHGATNDSPFVQLTIMRPGAMNYK